MISPRKLRPTIFGTLWLSGALSMAHAQETKTATIWPLSNWRGTVVAPYQSLGAYQSGPIVAGDSAQNETLKGVWAYGLTCKIPNNVAILSAQMSVAQELSGGIQGAPYSNGAVLGFSRDLWVNGQRFLGPDSLPTLPLFTSAANSQTRVDVLDIARFWLSEKSATVRVRARFNDDPQKISNGVADSVLLKPRELTLTYREWPTNGKVPIWFSDFGHYDSNSTKKSFRTSGLDPAIIDSNGVAPVKNLGVPPFAQRLPGGRTIFYLKGDFGDQGPTTLYLADSLGRNERRVVNVEYTAQDLSARNDGQKILYSDGTRILEVDLKTGATKVLVSFGSQNRCFSPVYSPDGSQIAFAFAPEGSQNVELWIRARNGTMRLLNERKNSRVETVSAIPTSWSPDGQTLACAAYASDHILLVPLQEYDLDTHPVVRPVEHRFQLMANGENYTVSFARWSPDGRQFLVQGRNSSNQSALFVADVENEFGRLIYKSESQFFNWQWQ